MKTVKAALNTNTRQNIVYKITRKPCTGNDNTPSRTIISSNSRFANAACIQLVERIKSHSTMLFIWPENNISLVPLHTEHYILTNTRIATTILNTIVRNKFNNIWIMGKTSLYKVKLTLLLAQIHFSHSVCYAYKPVELACSLAV